MLSFSFQPFPVLTTPRLQLRELNSGDVREVFSLRSDDNVNRYINRPKALALEDASVWMEKISANLRRNESIAWAIALRDDARMIGSICLWNLSAERECGELGYELLPDFQGKGFMREAIEAAVKYAFDQMKLRRIEAWTHPENAASMKLLESSGFQRISDDEEETMEIAAQENLLVYFRLNEKN
jgi:ribosomal-protein-alanine N-acetyltransferase